MVFKQKERTQKHTQKQDYKEIGIIILLKGKKEILQILISSLFFSTKAPTCE